MKRSILFLLLLCSMMTSCTSRLDNKRPGKYPIENLVQFLDKQKEKDVIKCEQYDGDSISRKAAYYSINIAKGALHQEGAIEAGDSCLRAFRWGCSMARQCYHKENHVLDKDSIVYALALDLLEGERLQLFGKDSYHALFKAARAATLHYEGDKEHTFITVEHIVREEGGKAEPYDDRPITKFIKHTLETTNSVKAYEVSYDLTEEDYKAGPQNFDRWMYDEERTNTSKTKGHLYVVPKSKAKSVLMDLKYMTNNEYVRNHPNMLFHLNQGSEFVTIARNNKELYPYSIKRPYRHKSLHSSLSYQDGCLYILVIDEIIGAYVIPNNWRKILSIKDHKVEYIPSNTPI